MIVFPSIACLPTCVCVSMQCALSHPDACRARAQLRVLTRHPKCKRALVAVLQQLSQETVGHQLALVEQQLPPGHQSAPGAPSVCASLVTLRAAFEFLAKDILGNQARSMKPVYRGFNEAWSGKWRHA
jgi:hypothetical protein